MIILTTLIICILLPYSICYRCCANLALTIKTNIGEFITLRLGGYLVSLHGYGRCSAVEMANVFEEDCKQRFRSGYWSCRRRGVLEGALLDAI